MEEGVQEVLEEGMQEVMEERVKEDEQSVVASDLVKKVKFTCYNCPGLEFSSLRKKKSHKDKKKCLISKCSSYSGTVTMGLDSNHDTVQTEENEMNSTSRQYQVLQGKAIKMATSLSIAQDRMHHCSICDFANPDLGIIYKHYQDMHSTNQQNKVIDVNTLPLEAEWKLVTKHSKPAELDILQFDHNSNGLYEPLSCNGKCDAMLQCETCNGLGAYVDNNIIIQTNEVSKVSKSKSKKIKRKIPECVPISTSEESVPEQSSGTKKRKEECMRTSPLIYNESTELPQVCKHISSEYLTYEVLRHIQHPDSLILFSVPSQNRLIQSLNIDRSKRNHDGTKKLRLILEDARNYGEAHIKVPKNVQYRTKSGTMINLSEFMKPNETQQSKRKWCNIQEDDDHYILYPAGSYPPVIKSQPALTTEQLMDLLLKTLPKQTTDQDHNQNCVCQVCSDPMGDIHAENEDDGHPDDCHDSESHNNDDPEDPENDSNGHTSDNAEDPPGDGDGGGGGGGGGGVGPQQGPWQGPINRPRGQAYPDHFSNWDRNQPWVFFLQQVLGAVPLTLRENRHILAPHLGGNPVQRLGLPSYPGNRHLSKYINKALLSSLLPEDKFPDAFGFSRDEFYRIRNDIVDPLLFRMNHRDHILTKDSITANFLIKIREGPSYRFQASGVFGVSPATCANWFHKVVDEINNPQNQLSFLHKMRNTGNPAILRELYEEAHQATLRNPSLHRAYLPAMQHYEQQNNQRGQMKLVIYALDSVTIATQQLSEHQHGKKNFSTKVGKCGVISTCIVSLDGMPKYITNMASSSSPSCTDERIMAKLMALEDPPNPLIAGGLRSFLTGPVLNHAQHGVYHDFFTVLIPDLGYKPWGRIVGLSFIQQLDNLRATTNGRVQHRLPPHATDPWFDENGVRQPAPAHQAQAPAPAQNVGGIIMDLSANAGTLATKARNASEHNFQFIWACKYFGRGGGISNTLLMRCESQPDPARTTVEHVLDAVWAIRADYGPARHPIYPLPEGVTRTSIGEKLVGRVPLRNYLCPYVYDITWERQVQWNGVGLRPTLHTGIRNPERAINGGVMHEGNLLDPYFTGLPRLILDNEVPERKLAMINELCCGPFLLNRAPAYIQNVQHRQVQGQQVGNRQAYHQLRQQVPNHVPCFYFDQNNAPANWPIHLPWQPIRILTAPNIPSQYKSNENGANLHSTVISYVPIAPVPLAPNQTWPVLHPDPLTISEPLQRIQMWLCGPRERNQCRLGARTVVPEVHVTASIMMGCVYAYNRNLYNPRHMEVNLIDPSAQPHLNAELANDRHH